MSPFVFSLESILELRARAQKKAEEAHAGGLRSLERAETEFGRAQTDLEDLSAKLAGVQRRSFRPADRAFFWNALNYQKDFCARLSEKLERAREDAEMKRVELLEAQRAQEALLKLKEKERQEHTQLAEREDRAMVDDFVNARHALRVAEANLDAA